MTAVPCNPPSLRRLTGRLLSALTLPTLLLLGGCLALRGVSAPTTAPVASPTGSSEHQEGAATPTATPARARPASALSLTAVFAPWYGYAADGNCQSGMGSYHWNNDPNMAGIVDQPEPGFYYTVRHWTGCARQEADQKYGCEKVPPAWDWFFGPPQAPIAGLSDDGVAFVTPRFDEYPAKLMSATYITWTPRSLDPLLTQCVYERQWQQLADQRDRLRLIVLYAWNLSGEQAYIEPAIATPPRPSIGRRYVERTRAYYAALLAGRPIVPATYCAYLPQLPR